MSKNLFFVKLTAFLIMLCICPSLNAQDKGDIFRDKIEKIKIEKLINKLELDDNTAGIFTTKYKDFSKRIKELNKKRFTSYKLMVENLESGNGLDTLVEQVIRYDTELNEEKTKFAEDLKTILTPKQLGMMIIFERKFNNELRKLLKDYRKNKQKEE